MSAIPDTFRAYVARKVDGPDGTPRIERGVREFAAADLPDGDIEIRVDWSSVNFKDGLATRIDGKVARIDPIIPGIDLAGEVIASGGVGSMAVAILGQRGHEVWAATSKADEADRLRGLGATGILGRDEVAAEGKPLESERWAAAVDPVGAATLPYVLRTLRRGAAVASCGNASGPKLETTVFPFILRGVAMLGMDSVAMSIDRRRAVWA